MKTAHEMVVEQSRALKFCGNPVKEDSNKKPRVTLSISKSTETKLNPIDQLFLRMGAMYGHIWQSQFKQADFLTLAKSEWRKQLTKFSDKIIAKAIDGCCQHYQLPPTLPQFYDLCQQYVPYEPVKLFKDHKPCDPKIVAFHLNEMKAILSGKLSKQGVSKC